jgi:hypothetical protein
MVGIGSGYLLHGAGRWLARTYQGTSKLLSLSRVGQDHDLCSPDARRSGIVSPVHYISKTQWTLNCKAAYIDRLWTTRISPHTKL